jgi:NADPH-dependent 2,4-dienoyl-CoA reductase/sulfur reductase-like enzyme
MSAQTPSFAGKQPDGADADPAKDAGIEHVCCDVCVVGAGAAGLSAAHAAATQGTRVLVLDAFPRPGGQYYMQPPTVALAAVKKAPQVTAGAALIADAERAGARILAGREVWGVFPRGVPPEAGASQAGPPGAGLPGGVPGSTGFILHAAGDGGAVRVEARAIVVATGAHDRVVPFPGWTLPGVMTPGAGQRLAKLSGTPPGRRTLVAGSGAFLLPVAASILKAGGQLAAVLEAADRPLAAAAVVARNPLIWREFARLAWPLWRARVPWYRGGMVVAALGDDRVRAAVIAPLDGRGTPDLSRTFEIGDIDALLVGYGFRPHIELTAALGCAHDFDEAAGGWHCRVDAGTGATTVAGVYAAGETGGIAGSRPARLSGRIAGLAAAESLGFSNTSRERRRLVARRRGPAAFATALNRHFAPPAGLAAAITDDTVMCRCEDVTAGEVRAALADGADDVFGSKLWTRAGMGLCQGRVCGFGLAHLIAAEHDLAPEEVGFNAPRIPLRPVTLSTMKAALKE